MSKGGTKRAWGEGKNAFCLHPKLSETLCLTVGGEGLKANVAHYCRVYAREAGEAAGKRGGIGKSEDKRAVSGGESG